MPFLIPEPQSDAERAVQDAGYPWVSTVFLGPPGGRETYRLQPHRHSSHNTHLIVDGQLTLTFGRYGRQQTTLDANSWNANQKERKVGPNVLYEGIAGPDGAIFVEGHSVLSPTTARRLEDRGDLEWVDGPGETKNQWYKTNEQKSWRDDGRNAPLRPVRLGGLY